MTVTALFSCSEGVKSNWELLSTSLAVPLDNGWSDPAVLRLKGALLAAELLEYYLLGENSSVASGCDSKKFFLNSATICALC